MGPLGGSEVRGSTLGNGSGVTLEGHSLQVQPPALSPVFAFSPSTLHVMTEQEGPPQMWSCYLGLPGL
jgi:hypothetical protein